MAQESKVYQTIIFESQTGAILKVQPNLYISSRRHLASLAGRPHWEGLAFMYFPHNLVVDFSNHRVKRLSPNQPPSLVSADGMPLDFSIIIEERKAALKLSSSCLIEFEGGAGDQLMEAAAVLTAMSTYPNSTFSIRADSNYVEMLRHVEGIGQVETAYVGQAKGGFDPVISNHTNYISDPRGGYFGKASLYGAWLGLQKVSKVVNIKLTSKDYQSESAFFDSIPLKDQPFNFLCQFRSGSGHGKSWQHEKVINLAALLHASYDSNVFVVGKANELPAGSPHIIDLTGQTTWWQTLLLVSRMNLVICIDSGIMHFSRALGVPYIALWGGTNAQVILGEDESPHDIRLDLPCRDLICYDCPNKANQCMKNINPEMVMNNAQILLADTPNKLP